MTRKNVINRDIERRLGEYDGSDYQTFSGTDIKAVMYMPLLTMGSALGKVKDKPKILLFGDLQTISISSTRSVSPVRVFGRSNPIAYTRGATTFAGTMVFATINRDAFSEIYDTGLAESYANASTSSIAHQLPPFSIVITAGNEKGATGIQVIHGITITNYGTTYSVDDLYTETTYTYIATDITPLVPSTNEALNFTVGLSDETQQAVRTITDLVGDSAAKHYDSLVRTLSSASSAYYANVARKQYEKDFPLNAEGRRIYGTYGNGGP